MTTVPRAAFHDPGAPRSTGLEHLQRRFALWALAAIALLVLSFAWGFHRVAENDLIDQGARANASTARLVANQVDAAVGGRLAASGWDAIPATELRGARFVAPVDAALRNALRGSSVVKVKLYDTRGLTLYSTYARQIGEDKSA